MWWGNTIINYLFIKKEKQRMAQWGCMLMNYLFFEYFIQQHMRWYTIASLNHDFECWTWQPGIDIFLPLTDWNIFMKKQ